MIYLELRFVLPALNPKWFRTFIRSTEKASIKHFKRITDLQFIGGWRYDVTVLYNP